MMRFAPMGDPRGIGCRLSVPDWWTCHTDSFLIRFRPGWTLPHESPFPISPTSAASGCEIEDPPKSRRDATTEDYRRRNRTPGPRGALFKVPEPY